MTRYEIGAILFGVGALVNVATCVYNAHQRKVLERTVKNNNEALDAVAVKLNKLVLEERPVTQKDVDELCECYKKTTKVHYETIDIGGGLI